MIETKTHWSKLTIVDREGVGDEVLCDDEWRHEELDEFRLSGGMSQAWFPYGGLPWEDPHDNSTWGPESPGQGTPPV